MSILRTKDIDLLHREVEGHSLKRALGVADILLMGIGVIIGTGIFVLTGVAAAKFAGPGIMLSFAVSSISCIFISLAYSELASSIPAAGSAYTYTYVAGGELLAWLVGWNLVLEYSVGASAVAGGWSAYFVGILKSAGIELPHAITAVPYDGGLVNLPAVLIVLFITFMLIRGIRESASVNRWLVGIKLAAIFLFLLLAGPKVDVANWSPFLPYGIAGISSGASIIFFAYLGVDSLATAAEETKNPQRDMPVGIILSLVVCTVLYVAVSCVLTGVVPYTELNNAEPVTYALRKLGYNFGSAVIGTGAIAGLTTVCLVMIYAQTRAFFAMSRDGLIPAGLCKVHPKFGTPHIITAIVGLTVAVIAGFTPIGLVAEMCNIGTLFAFAVTTACVLVLRKTHPDMKRPFRCPAVTIVVPLAMLSSLYIMSGLSNATWIRFALWSLIGLVIYAVYGARNSRVGLRAAGKLAT
jgi:basic amino acid/polyamine antiporter, APA family